jgi:CubicO group peptidase (beta-lactamase class C family)
VAHEALISVLQDTAGAHNLPGMVLSVAFRDAPAESVAVGRDGRGAPLAADSLLPVASITKLATALCVLRLADAGRLAVDDELARHLPGAAAARPGVTLRRLLSHTAGLPTDFGPDDGVPYDRSLSWRSIADAAQRMPLARDPGTEVVYSNLDAAATPDVRPASGSARRRRRPRR